MVEYPMVGHAGDRAQRFGKLRYLTKADALMVVCIIYGHAARIRSYELVSDQMPSRGIQSIA